jgi:NTP pyrophosphatase (non-canonical NTP hydrolase)
MPTKRIILTDEMNCQSFALMRRFFGQEHENQFVKWGIQTHLIEDWLMFTTEELGELAKAISEYKFRDGALLDIRDEAVQVATLSMKIAIMIQKKYNEITMGEENGQ